MSLSPSTQQYGVPLNCSQVMAAIEQRFVKVNGGWSLSRSDYGFRVRLIEKRMWLLNVFHDVEATTEAAINGCSMQVRYSVTTALRWPTSLGFWTLQATLLVAGVAAVDFQPTTMWATALAVVLLTGLQAWLVCLGSTIQNRRDRLTLQTMWESFLDVLTREASRSPLSVGVDGP